MAFLILLLISRLVFCNAIAFYIDDKFSEKTSNINEHRILDDKIPERDVSNITNYRLSNDIIPEYYFIKLDLSNVKDYKIVSIYGEISIDFRIIHPTKTIDFHAQRPYIKIRNYIFLQRFNLTNDYVIRTDLVEKSYNPSAHIFVLYFFKELSRGNYTLKMEFDCNVDDETKSFFQTTYINTEGEKKWMAATRFQGIGARQIFPCWDESELTATFRIAIKHHSNHMVLSNMPAYKVDPITNTTMWIMFKVTPVISTYLVAFTVFDPFPIPVSDTILTPFRLKFAQNISTEINNLLSTWFSETDIEQMQHVAIPNFPDNAMVNWGLNFYSLSNIIYEEGKDPIMRKIEVARLIAFKMIQQLLANLISPSSWPFLWLNDGISMLLGTQILDKIFLDFQIMDLFTFQYQYESLHLDCGFLKPLTSKISNSSEINSLLSYPHHAKAFTILNMLRNILSDYTIEHGIKIYFSTYKYKAASLDNFWSAMEIAQNNESLIHKYMKLNNVSRIMNAWTTQSQYPVLKIKQYHKTTKKIIVLLENFNILQMNDWWIPLTFSITEDLWDSTTLYNNIWLHTSYKSMKIFEFSFENYEEEEIIESLLNLPLIGYFRVNYDVPIWDRIIHLLVPKDFRNPYKQIELPALIRAKLIDDAFHFMIAGQLNSEIFWKMSKFLTTEVEYIVWYPMFKAFEFISRILPLPRKEVQRFKQVVQHLFLVITTMDINFEESPEDDDLTKCLKQEIAKWACVFDYNECLNQTNYYLMRHINSSFENEILPWWKKWIFCHGMDKRYDMWATVLQFWHNIPDPKESSKILEFLCCTKNEAAIKLMLRKGEDINLSEIPILSNLQVRDHITIFSLLIAKHVKNNKVLDYILSNFEELKPREISTVAVLINIINHVYSEAQLVQIEEFVLNNLKELHVNVHQKIKTRWFQIKSLYNDYLILL